MSDSPAGLKFVQSDPSGLPLKRKQVAEACASCRRRKKRCAHGKNALRGQELDHPRPSTIAATATTRHQHERPARDRRESRNTRFVGDLNPEHLLIEATSPTSNRDASIRGGIGVWQSRDAADDNPSSQLPSPNPTLAQTLQDVITSHVRGKCLTQVPPQPDYLALLRIYKDRLDPLYPAMNDYMDDVPQDHVLSATIRQAVALAAAADPSASPHLRLKPGGSPLTYQDFSETLATALQATLDCGLVGDRVLIIRLLLMLSMYMQPTSPEEADVNSLIFSRAVQQMQTLGLHIPGDPTDPNYQQHQSLFLCLWAQDRLNAVLYGRPCLIHERDVAWELGRSIDAQQTPFRLFLKVLRLLDQVIELYRPSRPVSEKPVVIDLPILEQLIVDAGATKLPSRLLGLFIAAPKPIEVILELTKITATVEILYHSAAILSCRLPLAGPDSLLPARATNSRRSLAADRITSLVQEALPGQISPLPLISYAVSLSLSVAYRKMRYSNVPMFRSRGRKAFVANTALLKGMVDKFWVARTIASMADLVLKEMDKAVVSMNQDTEVAIDEEEGLTELAAAGARPLAVNEPFIFETAPEVDVFGFFDPSFNLDGVDAALEGNLDFGLSSNWFDWQQTWG